MALPTHGRVLLDTTVGDIDIELWSKEAPKACRNFIALAMEGYYDGVDLPPVPFNTRSLVVPDFLVQTGDRTGSGSGGESFFGEPFEDEIHPRLRFAHRGLVGMANNGSKNSNDSQFFITLDRADELQGKHTLFGRCVGDTIYNVMKIGAMELDDNGRPVYPPKIKTVRIIDNPFDDIVPRITAEEKRAQQRARQAAIREREEIVRRKGAKKDTKLLSFGADADEEAEGVSTVTKKKSVARPDLVENLDQQSVPSLDRFPSKSEKVTRGESRREADSLTTKPNDESVDLSKIRESPSKRKGCHSARQTEIERMEAEVKRLARQRDGEDSDEDRNVKKAKKRSQLDEELAKYQKGRGVHRKGQNKDESNVLAVLAGFRSKLQTSVTAQDEADQELGGAAGDVGEQAIEGGTGIELDNDRGFMGHSLNFPKGNEEEVQKAEREYEVIDPRVRSAQARQEERERKHASRMGNKGPVRHGRG
ncbi:cyclophilin-like protein [Lactarius akahatsu]|uniref:Cyclophilin-like protein n=1 Tax=Lactarius akahatsu TaxID=416441 RepID=A0AAD4LUM3_9AGAM|nr:cyclophilin-like protein [Lactarius akahatsu]